MKNRLFLLSMILLAAFSVNSCKKDILTTDFSATLSQDFIVNEVNDSIFIKDTVVDAAAQNSDIDKYKDRIEKVTIEKVTYMLTSFTGDATYELKQGQLVLSDASGANPQTLFTLENVNLQGLLNNETQLTVNSGATDRLGTLVKETPHTFKLHAEGKLNKTAFSFIVKVKFYLKLRAKVL